MLCRDSRLSLCLHVPCCAERAVASHDVLLREGVYVSAQGMVESVTQLSHVESSVLVYGAL